MHSFDVSDTTAGQRVDQFLTKAIPTLNRSVIKRFIDEGNVHVDDTAVTKAGHILKQGNKVHVDVDIEALQAIPQITLPVLYEDDDCIVIDKPVGVLTHSKGLINPEGTVASFIAPKLVDLSGNRAGIVHRLDRVTSGVIICAKHVAALSWLQKQFSQRRTKKIYYAVVRGVPHPAEALIDVPIGRNPAKPQTFFGITTGKTAQTTYKVLLEDGKRSLLELRPTTGRTHQIRVHLSHINHPIVGDTAYGGPEADRVFLHAGSLEITLPNRERRVFTSSIPKVFNAQIES